MKMKYLFNYKDFNDDKNYRIINEVLTNEIPWGDTLLGRLINSLIRNIRHAINLKKIDKVLQSLKEELDNMIKMTPLYSIESEDVVLILKGVLYGYMKNIELICANKEDFVLNDKNEESQKPNNINEVIDIITNSIENMSINFNNNLNKYKDKINAQDINKIKSLFDETINTLKNYKDELNKLNTNETQSSQEISKYDKAYNDMLENFKSVYKICVEYNKFKNAKKISNKENTKEKENTQNPELSSTKENDNKNESINENETVDTTNNETNNIDFNLQKAIKPLFNYLSPHFSFPSNEKKQYNELLPLKNKQNKIKIIKIYKLIYNKLKINESFEEIIDRPEGLAKHIYNLYLITKSKPNGDFNNINNKLKEYISTFNKTMQSILNFFNNENINESLLTKIIDYDIITEYYYDDEEEYAKKDNKNDDDEWIEDMRVLWKKTVIPSFKNIKLLKLTDEQIKKIEEILNEKSKDIDYVVVNGVDPIFRIVKLFIRAYRLHTTSVIPSGRSGGRVSNAVFRQYDCFGDGSPENAGVGGGPYRHIKTFTKWENGVLDVLGDTKYKPVFSNKSVLIYSNGEKLKGFGPNLAKFMIEMLDSNKPYIFGDKSGYDKQNGSISNLLKKYFKIDNITKMDISYDDDIDYVSKISRKMIKKETRLSFEEVNKLSLFSGLMFKMIVTDDKGKNHKFYCYVYGTIDGTWVKMSKNPRLLTGIFNNTNVRIITPESGYGDVYFFKFNKIIEVGKKYNFNGYNLTKYLNDNKKIKVSFEKFDNIKINKISKLFKLVDEDGDEYIISQDNIQRYRFNLDGKGSWKKIYYEIYGRE